VIPQISLYFHIPFCTRKCHYCHFYVIRENENGKNQLLDAFLLELALLSNFLKEKEILTIYFGGGTPSLFGPHRVASVLQFLQKNCIVSPSSEITLEINPENVTPELISEYAKAGVNRASIGIQTLDQELLQVLGRSHDSFKALDAVHTTYREGISNISVDLMYDLPTQNLSHWSTTLEQIKTLPLQHISLYNLTIEPHTLFFKNQHLLRPSLPNEETSLHMLEMAMQRLEEMGFQQYEISAFAKPGYASQHNMGYWIGRPFLGVGPSAWSYWEKKRFQNIPHLHRYDQLLREKKFPIHLEEKLDPDAHRRELFVIHLRLRKGVHMEEFMAQHGELEVVTKQKIVEWIEQNCISFENHHYFLTKKGMLLYECIASDLI